MKKKEPGLYGLLAEFDTPTQVTEAARRTYSEGYRKIDAYSPFPIEELSEAVGFHRTRLPIIVFLGGIIGGVGGYMMQYYLSAIEYPLNVGGRPLHSWPSFIPITFETTVLVAAFSAVLGMLALNGLPQPYHPVFNVPSFALASRDRFFLLIETVDPKFDAQATRQFLLSLGAREVSDVQP
ncbi:MAG: DUF3341 domain-containing protein [Pyrinomonadaceae bacterium]